MTDLLFAITLLSSWPTVLPFLSSYIILWRANLQLLIAINGPPDGASLAIMSVTASTYFCDCNIITKTCIGVRCYNTRFVLLQYSCYKCFNLHTQMSFVLQTMYRCTETLEYNLWLLTKCVLLLEKIYKLKPFVSKLLFVLFYRLFY